MNADQRIDRLIDLTARAESKGDYSSWTENDNGHGPSFGLVMFNSTRGSLGKLIITMREAETEWFCALFGHIEMSAAEWANHVTLRPELFKPALQLSGQVPAWQKCQRDLARSEYFDPVARLCARYGLVSERAHAMAFDVAVQYGVGGLREMLSKTLNLTYDPVEEPSFQRHQLNWLAEWADTHPYDAHRRHKLLQSRELSDEPMFPAPVSETPTETRPTLRHWDSKGPEVIALQEALIALGYYSGPTYPRFGDATRAAVENFQAAHGLVVDGIVGEKTWRALDQAAKEGGQ